LILSADESDVEERLYGGVFIGIGTSVDQQIRMVVGKRDMK
jgi:hypothetical protein